MPKLRYTASGFPGSSAPLLSGAHDLSFTWAQLVWAAISVGRAGMSHILRFGLYSAFEIVYRTALVYANLRERPTGYLTRSAAYDALDPSEKGAISYFLGLTLSKLFAGECLSVPWLLHLDVYRAQLQAVLAGRKKPDLVGLNDSGEWVVIESKGRTNGYDAEALEKAKEQTRAITTIAGRAPTLRVGLLSYFEASGLRLAANDPEQNEDAPLDIPVTEEMVAEEYYRPFHAWLEEARAEMVVFEDRKYFLRREPEFDFAVGLDAERFRGRLAVDSVPHELAPAGFHEIFAGRDGVLVQLGRRWSQDKMLVEPEDRPREG
jgi:hypothetical protein